MPLQLCLMNFMARESFLLLIIIMPQLEETVETVHRLAVFKLYSRDPGDLPPPSGEKEMKPLGFGALALVHWRQLFFSMKVSLKDCI